MGGSDGYNDISQTTNQNLTLFKEMDMLAKWVVKDTRGLN